MSVKPEAMLRSFYEMFVDESSLVLDPTCGSGGALRAAESLGAAHVLGLEVNPEFAELATTALQRSRLARRGEKKMKRSPHYGSALAAQEIKGTLRGSDYTSLETVQVEALDDITTAISKIISGDADSADLWKTIEEYAILGREAC